MRLLIVDDHPVVRNGVRSLLQGQADFDLCGEAVDGQDAVDKACDLKPDVVVMDVSMPRLNGFEATRKLHDLLGECKVLILSQHESPEMARQALKAGARGYVVKSSIAKDLVAAILKVARGEYFFDPAILDQKPSANLDVQEILQRSAAFEQALRESEELYRSTFELAPVGVSHVSANGQFLRVNQKFCEIVGYKNEELMKKTFQDITHPDDLDADLALAEKVKSGKLATYTIEKRYIRKDGSPVWINLTVSALRDVRGHVKHFISVVEDISGRKAIEEALRQNEERLRHGEKRLAMALQASRTAMFEWDLLQNRGPWNPEMAAIYKFNPAGEYITVDEWKSLFHPDDVARLAAEAAQAWREKDHFQFEFRTVRSDGEIRWILSHGLVVRDAHGTAVRMIGTHSDITGQKQVEHELEQQHAALQQAQRLAGIGSWHWTAEGPDVICSEEFCRIAGRDPGSSSFDAANWQTVFAPESWIRVQPVFENARATGAPFAIELEIVRPDGEQRLVKMKGEAQRDARGSVIALRGTLQDITDRRQAEQSTNLLAAIVDSSDDAVISKSLGGIITSWNKSAQTLFGYSAEEAVGRHITLIVPSDHRAEEANILERLGRGERIDHFETIRRRKDGSLIDVSLTISPVKDSTGKIVGASKVARDISSRKQTERALAAGSRQQKALFHLADELHRARLVTQVYDAALDAILGALQCDRASILLCDDSGVMRFESWRGLSDTYRAAVDGHSAWSPGETNPQPVCIPDVDAANLDDALRSVVKAEGISALAFIPLLSNGSLIGKFMTYFNSPHQFNDEEIEVSLTISRQLAFAIDRKRNDDALRRSEERFRQLSQELEGEVRSRTKELEKKNSDLLRQSEQVRELSQNLLRAQDEERRRFARELHDSAGQTLAILNINLGQLILEAEASAPDLAARGEAIQEMVEQLSREIRTTSYLLHPPLLDETGLSSALNWYVQGLAERSGLNITVDIAESFGRYPRDLELAVFRLVQECLTNIHRHSGSKTASIRIAREVDTIYVEVEDEGKGIEPGRLDQIQSQGSGVGIRGMRERLRPFRGEMTLESSPAGTRVTATIPVPKEIGSTDVEPLQAAV